MSTPNHAPQNIETEATETPKDYGDIPKFVGGFPVKWASQQGLEASTEGLPEYREFDDNEL